MRGSLTQTDPHALATTRLRAHRESVALVLQMRAAAEAEAVTRLSDPTIDTAWAKGNTAEKVCCKLRRDPGDR